MKYENGFLIAESKEEWDDFYDKVINYNMSYNDSQPTPPIMSGTCSTRLLNFNVATMYSNVSNVKQLSEKQKEAIAWIESYFKFDFWDIEL